MFVYVPVLRPKGFSRVKTAARFTAEDPWHPGRRRNFTVDEYVPTMTNNQAVANTTSEWRWFVGFYRALNYDSHPSGPRRFLPDSLVELWRTDQIRTVDLPRLLRAIEPTLKDQDARPLLRDRRLKFFAVVELILCAFLEVCALVGVIAAHARLPIAIAVVLGLAALLGFFLDQIYYGKLRRRRRQMLWLLAQAESAIPASTAPGLLSQAQAQRLPPDVEPLIHHAFDDALFFPRDRKSQPRPPVAVTPPPPLPHWNTPHHDYTYDTTLAVSSGLEPRMESILQRDIPEFRWQDEAENWGKIRIVGNALEPFEGVTVSIARKEPPGPFNLRIIVRAAIRPAADAFHKAITQRIELALYAAVQAAPQVTPSFTKADRPFHPPFFSRESLLYVTREPGMALRIKDAIPELTWLDQAPDWEQVRIIGTSSAPRTFVSILRGDPTGPFQLWVHTAATSATIGHDVLSIEVLTSLLDRIYAATEAYPPTVTFNNELTIHEKRLPWLASILQKGIPELTWRNDPKKSDPVDTLRIVGTIPSPGPGVFVSVTPAQAGSSPYIRLRITIVIYRCFEHHAERFHRALLQRLNHSLRPNSYSRLEGIAPQALQEKIIEFLASPFSTPFVPPFFSLRAEVPVAEEFENDDASAFVWRLRDAIPELLWTSAVDGKGNIRIAAETDAQADGPAGLFPTENRSQHTSLSLFRPDPSVPFELWIHISAGSSDEADRALHSLEHRLCLVFRSGSDPDLKRNAQSAPAPPL